MRRRELASASLSEDAWESCLHVAHVSRNRGRGPRLDVVSRLELGFVVVTLDWHLASDGLLGVFHVDGELG